MSKLLKKITEFFRFLVKEDGSLKKKIIRSGFWVSVSSIGINLLTLLRSIILARILLPEVFGLMGICLIIITGMELFSQTGFSAALINRQEKFEDAKDTAFTLLIIRGIILALMTFLVAPLTASYYDKEILNSLIKVIGISFIFKGMQNINIVALEKSLNFRRIAYFEQTKSVIDTIVIITLVYYLKNIWGLVIGHVIAAFLGTLVSYIIISGTPHLRFNKAIAGELFRYGKFITGLTIVLFISTELDKIVIGKILSMEFLGYYVLAFMLANLPSTHISKLISRVMFPAYSKLQNDFEALRNTYLKVLRIITSLTIPAAVGIAILAPEIIRILYGEKWLPAVHSLQILCIFGGLRSITSLNGYLFNGIGKPQFPFYFGLIRLSILIIFLYPVTKSYGLIGAAVTVSCPFILQIILGMYFLWRIIGINIRESIKIFVISIGGSLIMSATLLYVKSNMIMMDLYSLVFLIVLGILTYSLINFKFIISTVKRVI